MACMGVVKWAAHPPQPPLVSPIYFLAFCKIMQRVDLGSEPQMNIHFKKRLLHF